MGFFEDAVERAKSAAQTAGQKASEAVQVEKLKINLSKAESELKKRYEQLGKLTYEARRDGCGREEASKALAEDIEQLQAQLAVVKDKIYRLKNIVCCPNCRAINEKDAVFCNKCGTRIVPAPCAAGAAQDAYQQQSEPEQSDAGDEE